MAMDNAKPHGRKRRKVCAFCVDKVEQIDYKDAQKLKRYLSERSKILPRRTTAEVVADNVYFGDSRRDGDTGSYGDRSYGGGSYGGQSGRPAVPAAPADYGIPSGDDQFAELADDDGDLPF